MSASALTGRSRGFALVELAAIVLVAALLTAMIASLGFESRRQARLGDDIANLRRLAEWTGAYANDNNDLFWSFSWKKGYSQSQWPDLNAQAQSSDLSAQAAQAVDILRRCAGRLDIQPITGWIANVRYAHLPLLDYLDTPMPDRTFVSSMDKHRIKWSRDPFGFDKGTYQPAPTGAPPGTNSGRRWPYSSSYQLPPAFFDGSPANQRMSQSGIQHNQFTVPSAVVLGARSVSDVAFPSHKVLLHDSNARHFGTRMPYCTQDQSRLPLLFVDSAVTVRSAPDSNAGWQPNIPTSAGSSGIIYTPDAWEPPTISGSSSEPVSGRFMWTRGTATEHGIAGRDFDGPETCSGQPGCP